MDDAGEVVTTETTAARYLAPGPGEVRIHVASTGAGPLATS